MIIEYKVLLTKDNIEREQNVKILAHFIPQLQVTVTGRDTLWSSFINQFKLKDGAEGFVLIEDDIKVCKDFVNKCEQIISVHNQDVISMFRICSEKTLPCEGYRGASSFASTVCNYFPRWFCDEILKIENQQEFEKWYWEREKVWNYPNDTYIRFLLQKLKKKYYQQFPHLAQHINYKSTLGSRPMNRITRFFIDDLEKQNGKAD